MQRKIQSRYQKLGLLLHISLSVSWFGAAIAYLGIAITGSQGYEVSVLRSTYVLLEFVGWKVIVPLSAAALLTGIIQSLITRWGLLRRWWVVLKLILTTIAFMILLIHMRDVSHKAADAMITSKSFNSEIVHALGGIAILIHVLVLSVYKPYGLTLYGKRRISTYRGYTSSVIKPVQSTHSRRWPQIIGFHAAGIAMLLIIIHLTGMH